MRAESDLLPAEPARPSGGESDKESRRKGGNDEALRLIAEAEALGIPWRQVLKREILAEGMLQRFIGSDIVELSLWQAVSVIPNSLFHSWRVRDLLDRLFYEASAAGSRLARQELAWLLKSLSDPIAGRAGEEKMLVKHYVFAYQRILELQMVALAFERSTGDGKSPFSAVCEATACSRRDAEWAASCLSSPQRSCVLDDAVARAREEGFEIPHAETALEAFSRLRKLISRHDSSLNTSRDGVIPLRRRVGRARSSRSRRWPTRDPSSV